MYLILGGCWDGKAGFTWCTLQAFYEYLILLKAWELKLNPVPPVVPLMIKDANGGDRSVLDH
jgi:hypothetical protein